MGLIGENDPLFGTKIALILGKYPEFYTEPASTKYHGCYEGGLFDHSVAVYEAALKLAPTFRLNEKDIDPISCIFHDLSKCGRYIKLPNGIYDYNNNCEEPIGIEHGSESLRRLMSMAIQPSYKRQMAISYHMGASDKSYNDVINFSKLCELYPEVLLLHTADMVANKIYHI